MKHLIVYAHSNVESLNHSILETTVRALEEQGHEVVVRDLYALGFNPVFTPEDSAAMRAGQTPVDIQTEQEYIRNADVITFIHPVWWTGLPAILKGYVDRVFAYGFAYASDENGIVQLLKGKQGLIISTHGTPKEVYDSIGMTDGLKITSDAGIFGFVGIESVGHLLFGSIGYLDEAGYQGILNEVDSTVKHLFPNA
ncbi:NAD(P)H-dependent oxidoreductase [Paenibacillus sp. WLX2291]|uniref:NAD(P)H-dependent oxidoreductase n=1 Tax=Paenibacillus sp. WLX2291 TaxID=3296934 RepID=UPI003983E8B5